MHLKKIIPSACLLLPVIILVNCSSQQIPQNIISIEVYENTVSSADSKLWSYVISDKKLISSLINDFKKIKKTEFNPMYRIRMITEKDEQIDLVTDGQIFEYTAGSEYYSLEEPLSILSFKSVAQKYSDDLLINTEWNAGVFAGTCSFLFFSENNRLMCSVKIPGSGVAWITDDTYPVNRDGSVLLIGDIRLFPDINGLRMEDTILTPRQ